MRVLIVGCGYVGLSLGALLVRAGYEVIGLRRTRSAEAEMLAAGVHPVIADVTVPASLHQLSGSFDWVIQCTAAGGGGPQEYRRIYVEGTRNLLSWLAANSLTRFVYTSSTSVYGQSDGSWVNEESPTVPGAETGRILLEAERLLLEAYRLSGLPATILRLAGIYGPGRGYWFKQFLFGAAKLDGDGSRFLNMIHRDDVVGAILAALKLGKPGEIFNVVDDEPVAQRELFAWLSRRLGKPMPQTHPESGTARKRGASNKRVSNRKLREQLDYSPRFPSFREGFESLEGS